jgi:hypothetical protein
MSNTFDGGFITVATTGATLVTGAASASVAIPVASDGNRPRYIRVAGLNACYVKLGTSGVSATNADTLIQPADAVILNVPMGITHIAAIQDSAAGRVNIVPLENV